jgi:hypothetical protein
MVPLSTTSTGTGDMPAASTALECVPDSDAVQVRQSTRSAPVAENACRNSPGEGWEVVGGWPDSRSRR